MTYAFFNLLHKSMSMFIDDFSTQTSKVDNIAMLRLCFDQCHCCDITLHPRKIYLIVEHGVLVVM